MLARHVPHLGVAANLKERCNESVADRDVPFEDIDIVPQSDVPWGDGDLGLLHQHCGYPCLKRPVVNYQVAHIPAWAGGDARLKIDPGCVDQCSVLAS